MHVDETALGGIRGWPDQGQLSGDRGRIGSAEEGHHRDGNNDGNPCRRARSRLNGPVRLTRVTTAPTVAPLHLESECMSSPDGQVPGMTGAWPYLGRTMTPAAPRALALGADIPRAR